METIRRVTEPARIGVNIPEDDILNIFENARVVESAPYRVLFTFRTNNISWEGVYCNGGDFISISPNQHAEPTPEDINTLTCNILSAQFSNENVSVMADWDDNKRIRVLFRVVHEKIISAD